MTDVTEPGCAFDNAVELVAMQNQEVSTVGSRMLCLTLNPEIAKGMSYIIAKYLVVIAGYVYNPRAALGHRKHQSQDVVVFLRPIEGFLEAPDIDNIAN
jgi:hypothetical protein